MKKKPHNFLNFVLCFAFKVNFLWAHPNINFLGVP